MNNPKPIYNIFIYCSGKCGSSTLYKTFLDLNYKTIHVHNNYYYCIHLGNNEPIYDVIDRSRLQFEKIYIIDCYRNPIERKMSSFFQHIKSIFGEKYILDNMKKDEDNINNFIDDLINNFNEKYIYESENYHSLDELIDYYNLPNFINQNIEQKYFLHEKDNIVFIKLLFDNINEWDNILSEIFNVNIKLCNDNITGLKDIGDFYKKFKDRYKVPKKYLDCFLRTDKTFKLFNSTTSQENYIKKWENCSI